MAARDAKEKELWAAFAVAAMQSYSAPLEADDLDEMVDAMVAVASAFADGMLDALDERYSGTKGGRRPAKTSKRKRREPDDDDDDLDDEDDD